MPIKRLMLRLHFHGEPLRLAENAITCHGNPICSHINET